MQRSGAGYRGPTPTHLRNARCIMSVDRQSSPLTVAIQAPQVEVAIAVAVARADVSAGRGVQATRAGAWAPGGRSVPCGQPLPATKPPPATCQVAPVMLPAPPPPWTALDYNLDLPYG